jgi:hypothetical protein
MVRREQATGNREEKHQEFPITERFVIHKTIIPRLREETVREAKGAEGNPKALFLFVFMLCGYCYKTLHLKIRP